MRIKIFGRETKKGPDIVHEIEVEPQTYTRQEVEKLLKQQRQLCSKHAKASYWTTSGYMGAAFVQSESIINAPSPLERGEE